MLPLAGDLFKHSALAVMLLAVLLAYFKGRHAVSADGRSLAWTQVPLIAFLTVSIGPSAVATLIYLGYQSGLLQAAPSGYRFSTFIFQLPLDFALMNWGFVALYVTCRLSPNSGSARSAMWLSATLMSFLNVPLFFLAPEMVSNVFDAGQGIGVIQAMLSIPLWFGPYPSFLEPDSGIGLLVFAPLAPIPFLGLIGWLGGRFMGWMTGSPEGKAVRS
ncbi:hypothetical protein [Rhodoplanes sp. Z2-YC6860]|uniref:hypothetical protein n=1 Tax=Rhodoplanes sp. Z2-YC6860 TaxID=674703 RepID=UPI00078DC204|nr:hypothetical protein [Rhodoplanes sp. Z2-YC6860]AMN42819.1 hypothetical protein RHPLAN_43900 [Rhodoplanes sp. Z2-YC6860]